MNLKIRHENHIMFKFMTDPALLYTILISLLSQFNKNLMDFIRCNELSNSRIKVMFRNLSLHPSINTYSTHFYMTLAFTHICTCACACTHNYAHVYVKVWQWKQGKLINKFHIITIKNIWWNPMKLKWQKYKCMHYIHNLALNFHINEFNTQTTCITFPCCKLHCCNLLTTLHIENYR